MKALTEYDIPVDPELVRRVMAQVNAKKPLKGARLDRPSKAAYWAVERESLRAAKTKADALITRREEEQKP